MKRFAIILFIVLCATTANATYIQYNLSGYIYDSSLNQNFDVSGSLYLSDELFYYLGDKVPADTDIENEPKAFSRFINGANLNIGNEYFVNYGTGYLYTENWIAVNPGSVHGISQPELWFYDSSGHYFCSNFSTFYDYNNEIIPLTSMATFTSSPYKFGLEALFISGFYNQEYYGQQTVWLTRADAPVPVPEPGTIILFLFGIMGLLYRFKLKPELLRQIAAPAL